MAYKKTNWQDTLRDAQGNVIQKGTPLNAQALGKIEDGIVAAEQKIDNEISQVTTQLAQKVSKEEARLKTEKAEPEDLSERTLALVTGTGTVNLLSVPQDGSVTPGKTTFLKMGKNLFNKEIANLDQYLAPVDGSLRPSTTYATSDYIKVGVNETFTLNQKQAIAFYREDKSFISAIPSDVYGTPGQPYTFTTPNDTAYIRFTLLKANINAVQLEKGSVVTVYEEYKVELNGEISVNGAKVKENSITEQQLNFLTQTPNLFDPTKVIRGGYIDFATGGVITSATYGYSPYIEVDTVNQWTLNLKRGIAFYDANYNYLSGKASASSEGSADSVFTFTPPANTKYVRFTVLLTNLDKTMFQKGTYNGFVKFGRVIPKSYMDHELVKDVENLKNGVTEKKTLKILSFGNSFSQDAHQWLHYMAASAGIDVILGNLSMGGQSLEGHYNQITGNLANYTYFKKSAIDGKISNAIHGDFNNYKVGLLDEDWDIITLQQGSSLSGVSNTYQPHLTNIINLLKAEAKNPAVKFALHLTWAFSTDSTHESFPTYNSNQDYMYEQITNANLDALISSGIDILIPSGTAIQNARTNSYLNAVGRELTRDGYHLNYGMGRYIAGLTYFETLLSKQNGTDIFSDVSFYPTKSVDANVTDGVDSSPPLAYLAKVAVKNAVQRPFVVTEF